MREMYCESALQDTEVDWVVVNNERSEPP
jgi:hypothetical protein